MTSSFQAIAKLSIPCLFILLYFLYSPKTIHQFNSPFPPIIHQTYKSNLPSAWPREYYYWFRSWSNLNYNHFHIIWDDSQAQAFFNTYFDDNVKLAYSLLPLTVQKTDFLRYALLYVYGGVYSDADTTCLKPVSYWHLGLDVDFIVGLEWDRDMPIKENWIQVLQWTIASTPNHPILKTLIDTITAQILNSSKIYLADAKNTLELTGPIVFTRVIEKYLNSINSSLEETHGKSTHQGYSVFNKVLVLPINSFNSYAPWLHPHQVDSPFAFVIHHYTGVRAGGWQGLKKYKWELIFKIDLMSLWWIVLVIGGVGVWLVKCFNERWKACLTPSNCENVLLVGMK